MELKVAAKKYLSKNKIIPFILLSLAFHLFLLWIYGVTVHFQWFPIQTKQEALKKNREIQFEFVETPKAAPKKPKTARFYSDKNSEAANPKKLGKKGPLPSSRGTIPNPEMSQLAAAPEKPSVVKKPKAEAEKKSVEKVLKREESPLFSSRQQTYETFSPDKLTGRRSRPMTSPSNLSYENAEFNVDKLGGLAFNTYDWDFAPYMIYLKKRIQQHIFPPPAFTKLGLIQGHTLLRFRIYPDGHLDKVQLVRYEGHKTLMETSVNAVEISAPFKPLPRDFPKDYLEITGSFWYIVKK
ncbi:MAG: hypothetical protein GXO76_15505 [Calditrichaeota bacterium]|nr:hypothetical protein [Calditrichota bacterium]